jgi:hypothetical protein
LLFLVDRDWSPPNVSTHTEHDLPNVLIQAGRRAWELYCEANSNSALDEDVAVSLLAKHLVALAGEGMTREGALAAAGLRYLISLTPLPAPSMSNDENGGNEGIRLIWEFCIDSANAKFLLQWRIPWA